MSLPDACMTNYRPNRVPGQALFFTVRLREPNTALLTEHISAFGEAIRKARGHKPFHVDAWAVLPDHAHAIWTLPPGDQDSASRWRAVKIAFSKAVRRALPTDSGGAIWKPHYTERPILDDDDYQAMIDYVHASPVSAGLCADPVDWPWSSVHRFVAEGFIIAPAAPTLPAPAPAPRPAARA